MKEVVQSTSRVAGGSATWIRFRILNCTSHQLTVCRYHCHPNGAYTTEPYGDADNRLTPQPDDTYLVTDMSLEEHELTVAEVLYRDREARMKLGSLEKQLRRISKALSALGEAIESELKGGQSRPVVKRDGKQRFSIIEANRTVYGGKSDENYPELPTADQLSELTDNYRAAVEDAKQWAKEIERLPAE